MTSHFHQTGFPLIVTAAVIIRDGRVLMARRLPDSHLAGLWEFPGGKVAPGETPEAALERELMEELGVTGVAEEPWRFACWTYPEKRVLLLFYRCRIESGEPRPLECAAVAWFDAAGLASLPVPPADEAVRRELVEMLAVAGKP